MNDPIQLNELVKQGSVNGALIGSKLVVDSAKHLSQVSRMTLDSGISLSTYGLDLNHNGSIQNAKEIFVETLHVKHLDMLVTELPPPPQPEPQPQPLPAAIELPDDMMLESLQVNNTIQLVPLSHSAFLKTDANGNIVAGPASQPCSYLTTDAQNHLVWSPIPAPPMPPPPLPPAPPAPTPAAVPPPPPPLPENLLRAHVTIPDHIPRFTSDTIPTVSSSSVKIDEADNVTGINKLETLELNVAELCLADQIRASSIQAPVFHTQKLNLGTHATSCTILFETNMYVSNGPFQPIGINGEGMYIFNLKIEDNTFSVYGSLAIGKTKVAFRSSFGAALGGVKSTQLEEHESESGFDYVIATLPEIGKIYLGVEQKTAEIMVKTDQEQLINMDICVQKTSMPWNRKGT